MLVIYKLVGSQLITCNIVDSQIVVSHCGRLATRWLAAHNSLVGTLAIFSKLLINITGRKLFYKFLFLFHYGEYGGTPETLNSIRSEYWISKGRVVVRKIMYGRECILCLTIEGYVIIIKLLVRCLEKASL